MNKTLKKSWMNILSGSNNQKKGRQVVTIYDPPTPWQQARQARRDQEADVFPVDISFANNVSDSYENMGIYTSVTNDNSSSEPAIVKNLNKLIEFQDETIQDLNKKIKDLEEQLSELKSNECANNRLDKIIE